MADRGDLVTVVARVRGLQLWLIPKNAQTAMRAALFASLGVAPTPRWDSPALATAAPEAAAGEPGFKAAFLRHPLDRLVSAWADKLRCAAPGGATRVLERLGYRHGMPFEAFLHHAVERPDADVHTQRQAGVLARRMDFLGRFERLEQDWARLKLRFGWLAPPPRLNASAHLDWRAYFDAETLTLAETAYAEDLELWSRL